MGKLRNHMNFIALAAALVLVGIDQLLKYFVLEYLAPVGTHKLIPGFVGLSYVENRGAAFGIFPGEKILLIGVTGVIILALIVFMVIKKLDSMFLTWTVALIIAGGLGNLIDRVMRSFVVDYIHLEFVNFAVFNFADCCVVVGTVLLIIYFLFLDGKQKDQHKNGIAENSEGRENNAV